MKLHITVLASSLALAMPALAKDIPLSQAESIAKSVTPLRCDRIPSRRIMPGYRLAVMIFILLRINRWGLPYFPPSIHCRKQY